MVFTFSRLSCVWAIFLATVLVSTEARSELFYLDRVDVTFSGANRFYQKNCSSLGQVEGLLENPVRFKVSLNCTTAHNRPIGLMITVNPSDLRAIGREKEIAKDPRYYCF